MGLFPKKKHPSTFAENSTPALEGASDPQIHNKSPIPTKIGRLSPDWMADVIQEHEAKGTFDNLPGKGKPLEIDPNLDMVIHVMKNANVLPPWLELQHEIRDDIHKLMSSRSSGTSISIDIEVAKINTKIATFNHLCPTPILQKPRLSLEGMEKQYEKWK